MASRHNTVKSSTSPNQPHSQEVEHPAIDSKITFKVPFDLIFLYNPLLIHLTLLHLIFHTKTLLQTKSFEVSLLKNLCTLFLKLKLINFVIIFEHTSSLLVKFLYSDSETLTSSIDDLIIDTISEIRQPIIDIAHPKTSEDPLDFQGDPTFFNFSKTQEGGYGPPEPSETNPRLDSIPSPQLNFTFEGSMAANPRWLTINALAIPRPQILYLRIHINSCTNLIPMMIYYLQPILINSCFL